MKTFKLFSMAALALAMAACSSEDNALENATPAKPGLIPFSATVAPLSGATTRTVYTPGTNGESKPIINVAWKEGDQIYITRLSPDFGTAGTVTVGEPNGDGSAPLSGNISGADGSEIEAQYPASASDWGIFTEKYKAQDGTLSGIQDNLDYRKGTGKISVIGGKATLADKLQMKSQIAIWKLTLQNTSGANLNATKVTIKAGSNIIAATKDISATSEVHMAVPFNTSPTTFDDLTIEATTADGTYTYAAPSAVNLSQSKYYQSTVTMAKQLTYPIALSAATSDYVGSVVTTDGNVYATVAAASAASKTAVAVIAYVGTAGSVDASDPSYKGLAIALSDAGADWCLWYPDGSLNLTCVSQYNNIADAIGHKDGISNTNALTTDGHTHAAATAAASNNGTAAPTGTSGWFLPSIGQWNLIVQGLASKKAGSAVTTDITTSNNDTYTATNLNSVITDAGGTGFRSSDYHSSTLRSDSYNWVMKFGTGRATDYRVDNNNYVRSVLAF